MSLDLHKLARLQEQLADLRDASGAQFQRYRERADAAERHRRRAVSGALDYQGLSLAQLLALSPEQLAAAGVELHALRAAERESSIAADCKAEYERRVREQKGMAQLLPRLEEYANAQ